MRMNPALGRALNCLECRVPGELVLTDIELAISVGGDGTMLGAVRLRRPIGAPVLGINAGALGFLTGVDPGRIAGYLPRVLSGDYTPEPRMMLTGQLIRDTEMLLEEWPSMMLPSARARQAA